MSDIVIHVLPGPGLTTLPIPKTSTLATARNWMTYNIPGIKEDFVFHLDGVQVFPENEQHLDFTLAGEVWFTGRPKPVGGPIGKVLNTLF